MSGLAGEGRKEKRFRVAREGQLVDGRELTAQYIQEMADTYNPENYAGRINIEHLSGWSPEPPFNAYGDILSAEAVKENNLLCLYCTISALPNLIQLNKDGQKLYPSIEFYANFAGTGKAYLVGLGLTDNPASLGTEPLKLSSSRHALRTQPMSEIYMSLNEEQPEKNDSSNGLMQQLKQALSTFNSGEKQPKNDEKQLLATTCDAVVMLCNEFKKVKERLSAVENSSTSSPAPVPTPTPEQTPSPAPTAEPVVDQNNLSQQLQTLATQMTAMQQQLNTAVQTPVNNAPASTGGDSYKVDY